MNRPLLINSARTFAAEADRPEMSSTLDGTPFYEQRHGTLAREVAGIQKSVRGRAECDVICQRSGKSCIAGSRVSFASGILRFSNR